MLDIFRCSFTREKVISWLVFWGFSGFFGGFCGTCNNETDIIKSHKRKVHMHIKAYVCIAYKLQCARSSPSARLLYCSHSTNLCCPLRNIHGWITRLVSLTKAKSTIKLLPGKGPGILTYETQFFHLKNRLKLFYCQGSEILIFSFLSLLANQSPSKNCTHAYLSPFPLIRDEHNSTSYDSAISKYFFGCKWIQCL